MEAFQKFSTTSMCTMVQLPVPFAFEILDHSTREKEQLTVTFGASLLSDR
jgi:hypothetical protein